MHKNASTIYRVGSVREFQNELTEFGHAPIALGNAIKKNIPEVDEVVRFSPDGGNFRIKSELFSFFANLFRKKIPIFENYLRE